MNKNEFLNALESKLKNLPKEEKLDALRYYDEYFEDAQVSDYEDVVNELGTPSEVASQILSEYAMKGLYEDKKSVKSKISYIWYILIALVLSPLAFPIALPILIMVFVGFILIAVFGFVLVTVISSLGFAGVSIFFSGITNLFSNFSMAILAIGKGLVMISITTLVLVGVYIVLRKIFNVGIKSSNKLLIKLKSKKKERY